MPTGAKSGKPVAYGNESMAFEEALKKLEATLEAMETGELPLETMLAQFEEGTRLAQICQAKLAEAELKIHRLEQSASGEMTLNPVALPETEA